ncbi:MFS transporter [Streptomyces jumonjinensis]|uniref:MFS transporter n=1 Tax=Streptomyces jumonjinensis TaxID=1945 RepID=A0A646KSJ2_STRJU|nr:MFS transporter [Streptomyces jumonjinensis]MQT03976.1 MFS transporter [Streptomyces jumonjinensis]
MKDQGGNARWVLAAALTVQFLVALDVSVVNVALPDMRDDLGFTPDGLQWVVGAYALTFGGLLMLGGRLGDIVGGRRLLAAGLALFGLASLAGGLVQSPGALIAARAAQGVGAAALAPVAFTLITVTYAAGPARSRALGMWGMAGAAGGALGVLAGGVLTDGAGWRAVMLVNVPIVLFALVATARAALPAARDRGPAPRLDAAGALLVTAGMSLLVLGVVRTESESWGSPATVLTLGGAAALLAAFVAVESRTRQPLLRPGLLGIRPVLGANVFSLLLSSAQFAAFYFCSLYMQQVLGYGASATGVAFLPFCAGVVAGSLIAARAVAAVGIRVLLTAGGLLGAVGLAGFAFTATPDGSFAYSILWPSLLCSVGIGMSFVPLGTAATADVVPGEAGMASGLLNSSRQIGGSLGLAVLVTVAGSVTASAAGPGTAALAQGYQAAYWVCAGLLTLGSLLAFALLPGAARTTPAGGPEAAPKKTRKNFRKNSGGDVDPAVSRSTQE